MDGRCRGDEVVVAGDARQRFHDTRGYGRPLEGDEIALDPVEAAHLLFRGDLDAVDGVGFDQFVAGEYGGFAARFLTYADLRSRGFYLSPAREGWVDDPGGADFVVYPRGAGPWDGEVAYRIRAVGERTPVAVSDLGEAVLAVVDEEGELTYFDTGLGGPSGGTPFDPPAAEGRLLADRVVLVDPPAALYHQGFFGQPLGESGRLQLSLIEAAYLVGSRALALDGDPVSRGRDVEGERFDRRLAAYTDLRGRGTVPKTGFKFGADFRVYSAVRTVGELGHSEYLVRVLEPGHTFTPRELALDVRLAGGVRKRTLFAVTDGSEDVHWLSVARLTP